MEMHHFMICCHNYGMETVCLLNKSDHDTAALSTLSRDSFIRGLADKHWTRASFTNAGIDSPFHTHIYVLRVAFIKSSIYLNFVLHLGGGVNIDRSKLS